MNRFLFVLAAPLALAVAGCGSSQAESVPTASPLPAASYKAGSGLQLAPAARDLIDLKTVDVSERAIGASGAMPAIPTAALLRTVKGDFAYVANGPWFIRTPVTVGATDGDWLQVTAGLYEGDVVVSSGVRTLWLAELEAVNGGVGCADGH